MAEDAAGCPRFGRVIADMDIAGFRLHPLKSTDRGRWSIWASGNGRQIFEFRDGQAYVPDYGDYY